MSRKKLLIENFLVYGIGNILYKLVPLVMLPIITRMLPSSYYWGLSDLLGTLVNIAAAVALLGMYDAVFRLFFDFTEEDEEKRREVCSSAFALTAVIAIPVMLLLFLFSEDISRLFLDGKPHEQLLYIATVQVFVTNLRNIASTPIRMLNQRAKFIGYNVIISLITYAFIMAFLWQSLYEIALPLGILCGEIFGLCVYLCTNHKWFSLHAIQSELFSRLIIIGAPLMPTFISLWVLSSIDKVLIGQLLGVTAEGVYAVANKLASASQLVTAAFASGWSYYNYVTMNDSDKTQIFSDIINCILAAGLFCFILVKLVSEPFITMLFGETYIEAARVVSLLLVTPIINMAFQLLGSQFAVIKQTWYTSFIAFPACIANVVLDYLWLPRYGMIGAPASTMLCYAVMLITASLVLKQKNMFSITLIYKGLIITLLLLSGIDLLGINLIYSVIITALALMFFIHDYYRKILSFLPGYSFNGSLKRRG